MPVLRFNEIWIPEGFAHGFLTLSETADLMYKTTNFYSPELDRCIRWDDSQIAIDWPIKCKPILSANDEKSQAFSEVKVFA